MSKLHLLPAGLVVPHRNTTNATLLLLVDDGRPTIRRFPAPGVGSCRRLYRKSPQVFRYAQATASEEAEILAEAISVKLWIKLWGGRLAAWLAKKDGNVFIENGIWIIIVVLAMIVPIEALRNALISAFGQITNNLNAIP